MFQAEAEQTLTYLFFFVVKYSVPLVIGGFVIYLAWIVGSRRSRTGGGQTRSGGAYGGDFGSSGSCDGGGGE
ncbi:MAG: hypothetical protein AAGE80_09870 [Pseudomonadota bacterium]